MSITVVLVCPSCGHKWMAALITPWDAPITPEAVAKQCYCRSCHQEPPMTVVDEGRLF